MIFVGPFELSIFYDFFKKFLLVSGVPFVLGMFSLDNLDALADTTIPSRKPSGR